MNSVADTGFGSFTVASDNTCVTTGLYRTEGCDAGHDVTAHLAFCLRAVRPRLLGPRGLFRSSTDLEGYAVMIPPIQAPHCTGYMVALGETLSIALLGTHDGRRLFRCGRPLAAKNMCRPIPPVPVRPFLDSIRGVDYPGLGAGRDQRSSVRPVCRLLTCGVGFRRVRKLFSEAKRPPEQDRSRSRHPCLRRQCGARNSFGMSRQVLPVYRRQGALLIEVE